MPGDNLTLETAILTDDIPTLSHLLTSPPLSPLTAPISSPLHPLTLSARLSRPLAFSHLLTLNLNLTSFLNTESFLLSALTGASVPIWRVILAHEPTAKNRWFGHYRTVVERCVVGGKKELSEYLLSEGATVEATGRPILLRAEVCGADEGIREILIRYGARRDFVANEDANGGV